MPVQFTLNQKPVALDAPPESSLLWALREDTTADWHQVRLRYRHLRRLQWCWLMGSQYVPASPKWAMSPANR